MASWHDRAQLLPVKGLDPAGPLIVYRRCRADFQERVFRRRQACHVIAQAGCGDTQDPACASDPYCFPAPPGDHPGGGSGRSGPIHRRANCMARLMISQTIPAVFDQWDAPNVRQSQQAPHRLTMAFREPSGRHHMWGQQKQPLHAGPVFLAVLEQITEQRNL